MPVFCTWSYAACATGFGYALRPSLPAERRALPWFPLPPRGAYADGESWVGIGRNRKHSLVGGFMRFSLFTFNFSVRFASLRTFHFR